MEELNKPDEIISAEKNDNFMFIGSKPIINYVRGINLQFSKYSKSEIMVKARGKFISKAVDIVEIAKRQFFEKHGIKIKDIKISTEQMPKENEKINISAITIFLSKINQPINNS